LKTARAGHIHLFGLGFIIVVVAVAFIQSSTPPRLVGISSFLTRPTNPYSPAVIDAVLDKMAATHLTLYRMVIWSTDDPVPPAQYYLSHSNYELIVCRSTGDAVVYTTAEWNAARVWSLTLLSSLASYQSRLWIEPVSKVLNLDFVPRIQTLIAAIRVAGYTSRIIVNKYDHPWDTMQVLDDPLHEFYTGCSYNFAHDDIHLVQDEMQTVLDMRMKIFNTDLSAKSNGTIQAADVVQLNEFLAWCVPRKIGGTVVMGEGVEYWEAYHDAGLHLPL